MNFTMSWPTRARYALLALIGLGGVAVVSAGSSSSTPAPVFEQTSAISTASPAYTLSFVAPSTESVSVTLTDLALVTNPNGGSSGLAPLTSVNLAVTANGVITPLAAGSSTGATLSAPGTVSFSAAAGTTYTIDVVGVPSATANAGNGISVQVASKASGSSYAFGTHSFVPTTTATPPTVYFAPTEFTVKTAGTYAVTLVDQAVPVALSTLLGFVKSEAPGSSGTVIHPGSNQLSLAVGTYQVFVEAVANATSQAGLFGVQVAPATGSAVLDQSIPVGLLTEAGGTAITNPSAGSLTLSLTDLGEPAPMASLAAAVTSGSTLLGQVAGGQSVTFNAPASALEIWQLATAASGSAGSFRIALTSLYDTTSVVTDPTSTLYSHVVSDLVAGSYEVTLTDLQFPQGLTALSYQVFQNGVSIAQATAQAVPTPFPVQAGSVVLVVTPQASTAAGVTSAGAYSVAFGQVGAATQAFATTQSVGANLVTIPFGITSSGYYSVALSDLGWPASFADLYGLVMPSATGTATGFPIKIYGGASVSSAQFPEGDYVALVIGVPASGQIAGLYNVAIAPAVPTVTLSASPAALSAGQGTKLTWSSTNATACTASGSGALPATTTFSGTKSTSGTDSEGPFSAAGTATYTLTCSGPGGSASASAAVTITGSTSSGSGGGGGALGSAELLLLGTLLALRHRRETVMSRRPH